MATTNRPTPAWKAESESETKDPVFFWKDDQTYGYLCQWYTSPFNDPELGIDFNTCEQYMMYCKAKTFGDEAIMKEIMKEKKPRKQKDLGRKVKGFNEKAWDQVKYDVVVKANLLKFRQCKALQHDKFVYPPFGKDAEDDEVSLEQLLLSTGERELVEASKFDRVWGIGYDATTAAKIERSMWGQNLLGKALMEVRKTLREETEP